MTEGQVQGKWVLVRNNGEFEITEFELAGSNCIPILGYTRDVKKSLPSDIDQNIWVTWRTKSRARKIKIANEVRIRVLFHKLFLVFCDILDWLRSHIWIEETRISNLVFRIAIVKPRDPFARSECQERGMEEQGWSQYRRSHEKEILTMLISVSKPVLDTLKKKKILKNK